MRRAVAVGLGPFALASSPSRGHDEKMLGAAPACDQGWKFGKHLATARRHGRRETGMAITLQPPVDLLGRCSTGQAPL